MQAKAVDFYLFSGTGNTLLVVQAMREVLGGRGWVTRCFRMGKVSPSDVSLGRTLGLAFPVAEQSTYPLVWDFCKWEDTVGAHSHPARPDALPCQRAVGLVDGQGGGQVIEGGPGAVHALRPVRRALPGGQHHPRRISRP